MTGALRQFTARRQVVAAGDYAAEVAADSPLSYWRLEETSGTSAADEQDARNGTVFGANLNTAGKVGSAASFDGTDDYIDVGIAPHGMTAVTVEAIIQTSSATGQILPSDRDANDNAFRGWQFGLTTGKVFITKIASGVVQCTGTSNVDDGEWHHVAATYDGANLRVYADGSLETTVAATGVITHATENAPLQIGRNRRGGAGGSGHFNGIIDEPAFYDHALTGARILDHAQAAGVA